MIIDEEVEEETVVIENDRLSSKSKSDSQATSKEKNISKVPKFLHPQTNFKDKEHKEKSKFEQSKP